MAVACAALALASCEQGSEIDVVQTGGRVEFVVTRPNSSNPVCVTSLSVSPANSNDPKQVWHVGTSRDGLCVKRFVYGHVPPGFDTNGPPLPLIDGQAYDVRLSGMAFIGAKEFTAGKSG